MTTRRNFLKNSTMLAAGLGISPLLASAAPTVSHKEETIKGRVNIALNFRELPRASIAPLQIRVRFRIIHKLTSLRIIHNTSSRQI